ncbi:hypothetical protein BGY98DRAFT_1101416 [Russula aff. rugulosa BPL654]|nr:hypothetical protein BGY98DRAFT_1101416 [Russula aff. rugulosa BPL654]
MTEVETYSSTHHSPPASLRGWAGPSQRGGLSYPHGSQSSEGSGVNQGSDGGSMPHNESAQPLLEEGASPTSPGENLLCIRCPGHKPFAQERGLKRHCEDVHGDGPHFTCWVGNCTVKWTRGRESVFRKHLLKKHGLEGKKVDEKLRRPAWHRHRKPQPRRKGSVIKSDPLVLPPPIGRDRQSLAEPQQRPLMPSLLDVGKDANHASPPLVPSVAWHGQAEPSELGRHVPTHAPPGLLSEGESAPVNGNDIIPGLWFLSPSPWGEWESTTGNNPVIPPNPGTVHIPALPSPVGGIEPPPFLEILPSWGQLGV